jgi:glycosyltransferase involved in cell wall biosynthesis
LLNNIKIIALLPVKNEEWVLPSYLSSVTKIADQIIALDDDSSDSSVEILESAGVTVIKHDFQKEKIVNMSARRQVLLNAGRAAGGTHFIWLDADETFSADFIPNARELISKLQSGQKMTMRWVHLWKSTKEYVDDPSSPFGYIWKDFIVCDDGMSNFNNQFISESRTQGNLGSPLKVSDTEGVVLHYQFSRWDLVQYKQALYRCTELIEGTRSARRINNTYGITLDISSLNTTQTPEKWISGIIMTNAYANDTNWYRIKILEFFNSHGIEFFEPLQIWHIPELMDIFIKGIGRNPKSQVFPSWLIYMNRIKNIIKNVKKIS